MKTRLWELGKVPVVIRDLWKGLTMAVLGVTLFASSFLVPFHTFLPAWTYRDGYYIMKSREQRSLSIGWGLGSFVRGMLATKGEDGHISITIKDYDGNVVINERTVSGRLNRLSGRLHLLLQDFFPAHRGHSFNCRRIRDAEKREDDE